MLRSVKNVIAKTSIYIYMYTAYLEGLFCSGDISLPVPLIDVTEEVGKQYQKYLRLISLLLISPQ